MKIRAGWGLALALAAASRLGAQANAEPRDWPAPPIVALIGERERLQLTGGQVMALDSVFARWNAKNDSLTLTGTVFSTSVLGTTASRGRSNPRGKPEASANNLRAARAVEQVLDARQRDAVCALNLAPTDRRSRSRSPWPWCASRAAEAR